MQDGGFTAAIAFVVFFDKIDHIQEEAVVELANILEEKMKPTGLALVMEADHFCMQWRGVKDLNSKMVNSVMRGSFLKDANLRREFLALMDKQQGK